jgi:hypothetical protein
MNYSKGMLNPLRISFKWISVTGSFLLVELRINISVPKARESISSEQTAVAWPYFTRAAHWASASPGD